jgi:hypothetical protein
VLNLKSKLESFLILFIKLQKQTNNLPANLEWLVNEKPNVAELCYFLNKEYIEISRVLLKKPEKHTISPNIFSKKWDDYKNNWAASVAEAAKIGDERLLEELAKYLQEITEQAIADGKAETAEEFLSQEYERLLEERGPKRLDPLVDNPAGIIDDLYGLLFELLGNDFFDGVINGRHLEAWDFFKDIIGIDYSKIYSRWQSAPELFIPIHMLNRNITPVQELYNEAVRAYVFGLTEASVAMCRALLEHILRKYYRFSGDDLSRVISEAERKHGYLIRGLHLHSKRDLANKILHDYENRGQEIEKAALDFLQTIRHLVTNIPSP